MEGHNNYQGRSRGWKQGRRGEQYKILAYRPTLLYIQGIIESHLLLRLVYKANYST
jgi:hypothetical protein